MTEAATTEPLSLPPRPPWPHYPEKVGLHHVEYEFEMLDFTAGWIQRHAATADRLIRNAVLESYAIHVRALVDFLGLREGGIKKKTDLSVCDYVSDLSQWQTAKEKLEPFDYKTAAIRTGERVAHLTKARTDDPGGKGWPLAIVGPLREHEILLFRHLRPEFRHGPPRTATTWVRVIEKPDLSTTSAAVGVTVSAMATAWPTLPLPTRRP